MSRTNPYEMTDDSPFMSSTDQSLTGLNSKAWQLLSKVFWNFINYYGLSQSNAAELLGLSPESRKTLKSLEEKKKVPHSEEVALRIIQLLSIHKNLMLLYPHNEDVIKSWMTSSKSILSGKSPIDYILRGPGIGSFTRLFEVRRILDQIRVR